MQKILKSMDLYFTKEFCVTSKKFKQSVIYRIVKRYSTGL